jgi:hypothetical protein
MKKTLSTLAVLFSLSFLTPLFATIPAGGGLTTLTTSTYIGNISAGQTLTLDLMTAQVADVEMRLVNVVTNEIVYQVDKYWDYYSGTGSPQESIDITNIPEGIYRVELDMVFPDYIGPYPGTMFWWQPSTYFDPYSGYGACYLDVGANESDVWSWGGAGLILW